MAITFSGDKIMEIHTAIIVLNNVAKMSGVQHFLDDK